MTNDNSPITGYDVMTDIIERLEQVKGDNQDAFEAIAEIRDLRDIRTSLNADLLAAEAEIERLTKEVAAWKQVNDSKKAENDQLRRDGNTVIDKVLAGNKRLRTALEPFAQAHRELETQSESMPAYHSVHTGDLYGARRALESKP